MSNEKKTNTADNSLFGKQNYMWMLIGLGIMALGFF